MRTSLLLTILVFALSLSSCKKERWFQAEVIRDCTGTYLRIGEIDYKVCNLDKVASFSTRTQVEVRFDKIEDCHCYQEVIVCEMLHEHSGWMDVQEIK